MVWTRLRGVVPEGSSPSVPRAQFLSMYVLMKPERQVFCPNAPHTRWWYRHRMTGIEILAYTRETGESTGVTGPWQFWNPAGDMSDFLNYVSGSRTWPSLQALGSVLRVRLSFSWNIHMFAAECFYWIASCHYDFGVPTSSFYVVSLTLSVQADRVSADMFFSRTLWIFLEIHWVLLS